MRLIITTYLLLFCLNLFAQPRVHGGTFEMRYFSGDKKANGETDFKGETEWMNTGQRVQFLNKYSEYASRYFGNPDLDKKIVSETEIQAALSNLKPQPTTTIRQTLHLNGWKAYGYKEGQDVAKQEALEEWESYQGASIIDGALLLENSTIEHQIDTLTWRFKMEIKIKIEKNPEASGCSLSLGNGKKQSIELNLKNNILSVISSGKPIDMEVKTADWLKLEIEGDFTQKRFNLLVNGKQLQYYIPMADTKAASITQLSIQSEGKVQMDDLFIFNHTPVDNVRKPYASTVVLDEDFEVKPQVSAWQQIAFDDLRWKEVDLPSAHGGVREKEEDYYLRKKIAIGDFERATLMIETLDPGGEVWVNNQVVGVVNNRHPVEMDVTKYLNSNSENLVAIKVKPYQINNAMTHSPTDPHIGWFLGRTKLLLTKRCMIKNVMVNTANLTDTAIQLHKIQIQYNGNSYFQGSVEINYYQWFPVEGGRMATFSKNIQVRPRIVNGYEMEVPVASPNLWSSESPSIYKVEVILKDQNGMPVDDYVTTTGIRTIEQKNGDFYVNGKPEMLNGAQIMGFRTPIETMSKYNRCAPAETVAEEMLMIKKMGGNLLRMHVHAEKDTADGINDPRYAELADQMGIYLIWQTAAWIREGEAWNVDFDGYPKYMKQVYNHPSIVIWEAGNHPNKFKDHDLADTDDYVKTIYDTIYSTDQSRLISPTTFWQHTHYANYEGTLDYQGNKIKAVPEFMEGLVTRGSQDAYTGYGADWSAIRKAPNDWATSCITSKEKAYFNFEHEESAGQPNWDLSKGKPWYLLQSYEWEYDEGSIGRKLSTDEWKASQAWQAFSAWESMKKQTLLGYDGFSWCCLHGGANMGTYQKPLIDNLGHPKLAFYTNKMAFQKTWAGSNNVDVVYGPDDLIIPVVYHRGDSRSVDLVVELQDMKGKALEKRTFRDIELPEGNSSKTLEGFRFRKVNDGIYVVRYDLVQNAN